MKMDMAKKTLKETKVSRDQNFIARIYWVSDYPEYQVFYWKRTGTVGTAAVGARYSRIDSGYYTDCFEDAKGTADLELNLMEKRLFTEQVGSLLSIPATRSS